MGVCVSHLQLDVQLGCRTGQLTQIGQDVFTEVRYKTSGMDIFLPEEKQDQSVVKRILTLSYQSELPPLRGSQCVALRG